MWTLFITNSAMIMMSFFVAVLLFLEMKKQQQHGDISYTIYYVQ